MKKARQLKIPFKDYPERKPMPVHVVDDPKPVFAAHDAFQVSEIDLVYRSKVKPSQRPVIRDSEDAYKILMSVWDQDKIDLVEEFHCLYLDRKNSVIADFHASTGGQTSTVIPLPHILLAGMKLNAVSLLLAHNHPSGSDRPSGADIALTQKVVDAAYLLDMKVLDHEIVRSDGHYSMADNGDMPSPRFR